MTTPRELLELTALALGISGRTAELYGEDSPCFITDDDESVCAWLTDSADCADMCAALGIDTAWRTDRVNCAAFVDREIMNIARAFEKFERHSNDKSAAWRMAAVRVAAEIGSKKP